MQSNFLPANEKHPSRMESLLDALQVISAAPRCDLASSSARDAPNQIVLLYCVSGYVVSSPNNPSSRDRVAVGWQDVTRTVSRLGICSEEQMKISSCRGLFGAQIVARQTETRQNLRCRPRPDLDAVAARPRPRLAPRLAPYLLFSPPICR